MTGADGGGPRSVRRTCQPPGAEGVPLSFFGPRCVPGFFSLLGKFGQMVLSEALDQVVRVGLSPVLPSAPCNALEQRLQPEKVRSICLGEPGCVSDSGAIQDWRCFFQNTQPRRGVCGPEGGDQVEPVGPVLFDDGGSDRAIGEGVRVEQEALDGVEAQVIVLV